MSILSKRSLTITFSGDIPATIPESALNNGSSPGQIEIKNLVSGANTITAPIGPPTALTIIPPISNILSLTLKGVTGDTGIPLHVTDPTTIALDPTFVSLCLTTGGVINGVRFIWS